MAHTVLVAKAILMQTFINTVVIVALLWWALKTFVISK